MLLRSIGEAILLAIIFHEARILGNEIEYSCHKGKQTDRGMNTVLYLCPSHKAPHPVDYEAQPAGMADQLCDLCSGDPFQ